MAKERKRKLPKISIKAKLIILALAVAIGSCCGLTAYAVQSEPLEKFVIEPQKFSSDAGMILNYKSILDFVEENIKTQSKKTDLYYFESVPLEPELQDYIVRKSIENKVPYNMVFAVIYTESRFKPNVVSKGNYGLMQINKVNHSWLKKSYGITDFLNPYENVYAGIKMLSSYYVKYNGDWHKTLMAYNMGGGGASRAIRRGATKTYYSKSVVTQSGKYILQGVDCDF